ncbi:MAG TPA: tRNA dimethylallyltransferase, partial [Capillimicrobium sp.]|nr:tRNA dimethylallyltransferase [Capillimicrobium sp.]
APDEVRERWMLALQAQGAPALHAELRRRAPWAAERVSPHDAHRIVRLLELDDLGELEPPEDRPNQLWTEHTRHPTRLIGVTMEREALYARIDARVDAMVAAGAVDEVRAANAAGASETARKALGFTELLAGDVDAMKRRTRNYAKRQLTWMRKLPNVELVDLTGREPEDVAAQLLSERP